MERRSTNTLIIIFIIVKKVPFLLSQTLVITFNTLIIIIIIIIMKKVPFLLCQALVITFNTLIIIIIIYEESTVSTLSNTCYYLFFICFSD